MPKRTNLRIVLPKPTMDNTPCKQSRRMDIEIDEHGKAWIDSNDALRILSTTPTALLEMIPEYQKVLELIDLERKWDDIKRIYSTMPEIFEREEMTRNATTKAVHALLRLNMRPFHALALMDLSMLKVVLRMAQSQTQQAKPEEKKETVRTFCGSQDAKLRCSLCKEKGCVEIFYCSKDCQTNDWKTHKKMCAKTLMSTKEAEELKALAAAPANTEVKLEVVGCIMRLCEQMKLAEEEEA
jgi:hypothetical protein